MIQKKIDILIADDHPLLLRGLSATLDNLAIIGKITEAKDGKEALEKIKASKPDIAILDIDMPFLTGIDIARKVIGKQLSTKIVFLTLHKEKTLFDEAQKLGVSGYVLKEFSLDEIEKCILKVCRGGNFVSPAISSLLQKNEEIDLSKFTKSEINIIKLIAQNKTTPQIAEMLFVSSKTIENHRANIVKKLELKPEKNSLLKWVLKYQEAFI